MRISFVPLQFVRKLKVKGEQHIMRSVPFHYIIPFILLVMQAVYSRSDWFVSSDKKPYKFALFLLFLCMYYFYALLRRFDPLFERGRKVGYTVKVKPNVIICTRKTIWSLNWLVHICSCIQTLRLVFLFYINCSIEGPLNITQRHTKTWWHYLQRTKVAVDHWPDCFISMLAPMVL